MCFTRIYGFIFCDPKSINSSAIKNITRSGTTFTATRLNNGTFTFTQQDNNTTYANFKGSTTAAAGAAGLVPAPGKAPASYYLRNDGSWYIPPNTTYAVATTAANGLMSASYASWVSKLSTQYAVINKAISSTTTFTLSHACFILVIGNGNGHRSYTICISGGSGVIASIGSGGTTSSFSASISGTTLTVTTSISIVVVLHTMNFY